MIVTVHASRIRKNLETMRLAYGKPLIFMCKANAYGHGMREVAPQLCAQAFGVATEEEGAILRACLSEPILVTAPRIANIPLLAVNDLTPLAGEERYIRVLLSAKGVKRCHIKIDSGMQRLGISSPKGCYDVAAALVERGIAVEGVCTHYKDTSEENVLKQNLRVDECVAAVRAALFSRGQRSIPYTHVTASGFGGKYDLFRVGLAAYGYAPRTETFQTAPAMEVFSEILRVKRIHAGDTLGYSGSFIADRPLTACTVLGGYADGMDRRDVGGFVLINGKKACIAAVCMDTFEVASEAVDLSVGDRVIILSEGTYATVVAERRGSIPYEVLVGFDAPRADRTYD